MIGGKTRKISEEETNTIIDLIKKGHTNKEICEMTERSLGSVLKVRKKQGFFKSKSLSKEKYNRIVELLKKGFTTKEIAKMVNCGMWTVSTIKKKEGLTIERKTKPKRLSKEERNRIVELLKKSDHPNEISKKFGVSSDLIYKIKKKEGLSKSPKKYTEDFKREAVDLYVKTDGMTASKKYNVRRDIIGGWARKMGKAKHPHKKYTEDFKREAVDLYVKTDGITASKKYNVSADTLSKWARKMGKIKNQHHKQEQKDLALDLANKFGKEFASSETGIPVGTIKRWIRKESKTEKIKRNIREKLSTAFETGNTFRKKAKNRSIDLTVHQLEGFRDCLISLKERLYPEIKRMAPRQSQKGLSEFLKQVKDKNKKDGPKKKQKESFRAKKQPAPVENLWLKSFLEMLIDLIDKIIAILKSQKEMDLGDYFGALEPN